MPSNFITLFLWIIIAIAEYGEFSYFLQLKEYRLDRFKDFLHSKQGKIFFAKHIGSKIIWGLLALVFLLIKQEEFFKYLILLIISSGLIIYFLKSGLKRPKITAKSSLIIFLPVILETGLFFYLKDWQILFYLFLGRFLIIAFFTVMLSLLTDIIKKFYIRKASLKIKKYSNLKIIGITGSYGKTSVKNFLGKILESKYRVIKTPKNINTEIGIAQFILKNNFDDKDIFIVEMGAYRMGEIKTICNMVRPEIGILTAINEQHLSLFGDIRNTQKAKYELLKSLPQNGLAVVNSDNFYCRENLSQLKCNIGTFGAEEEYKSDCLLEDVEKDEDGYLFFSCLLKGEALKIKTKLIGEYNACNVAPCILVAGHFGFNKEEIINSCYNLSEGGIKKYQYGKSLILDDSYNSNPDGFKSALKMFADFPERKKIVITRGMLELGPATEKLHQEIGKIIKKTADELIVISPDYKDFLLKGTGNGFKVTLKYKASELLDYVRKFKDEECLVLVENRVPGSVLEELIGKE